MLEAMRPWRMERWFSALAIEIKTSTKPAILVLEDGEVFRGKACGAKGEATGEVCFNTTLVGYLEVVSDPSYAGQIVTMTYPHIGNYGVNLSDMQSDGMALKGLVVRSMCYEPSNFRSEMALPDLLEQKGVVAIEGVDTRKLTRHIRDFGAMRGIISTIDFDVESLLEKVRASEPLEGKNLAATVSTSKPYKFIDDSERFAFAKDPSPAPKYRVAAIDCGIKRGILRGLVQVGCEVEVLPWDTDAQTILDGGYDGVFFSNGPGDPEPVDKTIELADALLSKIAIFGICLGNQMLSKACDARIIKLKFGHHGGNQPVMNLLTGRVEITSQNHGFAVDFSSLGEIIPELSGGHSSHEEDLRVWSEAGIAPVVQNKKYGRIQLTHVNLNDGTSEGIAFLDIPAFSVQYHPEASPGPTDSGYLFNAFVRLMENREDYLDIDIAQNRLAGWHS